MEGLSLDISSVIQDTLCSDINQSKMETSAEFAAVSNDSLSNPRNSSSSSDEETTVIRVKKRVQRFSDSDTDKENDKQEKSNSVTGAKTDNGTNTNQRKSMAKYTLDNFASDSSCSEPETNKNEIQQSRIESKRNKIREKFKKLATKHKNNHDKESHNESNNNSEDSDPDVSSVAKIKQKIKERLSFKPSICDPDTSEGEEDEEVPQKKHKVKQKKLILTSPKPIRMSAKQAMENMHKIKSESNRLLREKEVSLPYHRPKALSLKDILNRRKPALAIDGKVLPIKMNGEQLKEYVLLLEQRQKEMMELCKSESDEENDEIQAEKEKIIAEEEKEFKLVDNHLLENNALNKIETEEIIPAINASKEETTEKNLTVNQNNCEEVENHNNLTNMEISHEEPDKEFEPTNKDSVIVNHSIVDITIHKEDAVNTKADSEEHLLNAVSEKESQLISLYYDSEKSDVNNHICENIEEIEKEGTEEFDNNDISENEIDFDDIDKIIENSKIIEDSNSTALLKESLSLKMQPKLTGRAGMVIDLDDSETPKKLTGLELLKERFTYFARLKTPDELEREREKRLKPGTQHLKLKQELEEQIAEKRSIEWAKRFEEEKQQQMELKALRGELSDDDEDIEKIEAKLEEKTIEPEESSSEEEEEEEVTEIKENIRKKNPMIDDEAEVTDCEDDDTDISEDLNNEDNNDKEQIDDGNNEEDDKESSDESSDNESSESDNEEPVQKKGRILKAFEEDSDDESINVNDKVINQTESKNTLEEKKFNIVNECHKDDENIDESQKESQVVKESQDDPIQLAQRVISASDDLFTSQESGLLENKCDESFTATQTFSILDSKLSEESIKINNTEKLCITNNTHSCDNNAALESQTYTENFIPSQITKTISSSQSQLFGEDILDLCTGKFYDNEFITQANKNLDGSSGTLINNMVDKNDSHKQPILTNCESNRKDEGNVLQSILEELHNSETDSQKPNKYFISEQDKSLNNSSVKKKFVIDSDEEDNDISSKEHKKKKKIKIRKPETRVLQISDDEDDEQSYEEETYEYNSSDIEDETDKRDVEYDSEENEIEVKPQINKKKRNAGDFFEEEAELTSEDEWVGSGDEDEADLDRMEREEGDDDVFHQGKLQKELGQIHMRDVLDQDKREVRLIQELLFEDGDLGDGHRQRKFRWKNADGEEETGTVVEGFTDTQEEEFESEELWRKQRHEREVFLRQMEHQVDPADNANVNLNRTKIIKANLCSKTMSSLLLEVNSSNIEKTETTDIGAVKEKKTATNQSNPQKAFTIFQQNYHKSLLTRGQGALARLAALATPLAIDDDAPNIGSLGPSNRRNFVFASITPVDKETKVSKRKADSKADTPRLVKKLKTDEKQPYNKNSLLNHLQI